MVCSILKLTCNNQAELSDPLALREFLKATIAPAERAGETGYYLATFEAAVDHLLGLGPVGI